MRTSMLSACCCSCSSVIVASLRSSTSTFKLPDVPYVFPKSSEFSAERSGMFGKKFIESLPRMRQAVRNAVYVPSKPALWSAPSYEAMESILSHTPYHSIARYVMEHKMYHLLYDMLVAADAPLPHVMYEDFMKCKVFSSHQAAPQEQYALEAKLLRGLLCIAAHTLLVDPDYFTSAAALMQTIEQQQVVCAAVASGWVFCCAAAGRVEDALQFARLMASRGLVFDSLVFSLLQHPHASPKQHPGLSYEEQLCAKGFLQQQRLQRQLSTEFGSDSIAAHALFTFYSLTLSHVKKWETIRLAVELGIPLCGRTVDLMFEVFQAEKGLRCGPKTVRAVVRAVAECDNNSMTRLLHVLLRCRKNELLPEFAGLPTAVFHTEDIEYVFACVRKRGRRDEAAALPLVADIMRTDAPEELAAALESWTRADAERVVLHTVSPKKSVQASEPPTTFIETRVTDAPADTVEEAVAAPPTDVSLQAVIQSIVLADKKKRRKKLKKAERRLDAVSIAPSGPASDPIIGVSSAIEGREVSSMLAGSDDCRCFDRGLRKVVEGTATEERLLPKWQRAWINADE